MEKQPVGQLPDLTQSNNDDEIMVITDSEHNQLKKEKISDFITDLTSTNENNALTKGTDGKMFVTDFGNASNITEGTLPVSVLPNIPKELLPEIETTDLPVSGVSADTYAYPSSVTVNAQGQVTAIEEGSPSGANANTDLSNLTETGESHFANPNLSNLTDEGEKHFLNKTQITNCILEAPNGVAELAPDGYNFILKQGLKVLIPNGRNADGTLKNIEVTLNGDETYTGFSSSTASRYYLFVDDLGDACAVLRYLSGTYANMPTVSDSQTISYMYYAIDTNKMYLNFRTTGKIWKEIKCAVVAEYTRNSSGVTSLTPYQPVELIKRTDPQIQAPYITETYSNGTSWYRVWSDGWCEQGGTIYNMPAGNQTYNLLKPYKDQNYILLADRNTINFAQSMTNFLCGKPSGSQIMLNHGSSKAEVVNWLAKGYVV